MSTKHDFSSELLATNRTLLANSYHPISSKNGVARPVRYYYS